MGHEGHDHDHEREREQADEQAPAQARGQGQAQPPAQGQGAMTRGAGKGKLLFFDAPSGLAGDMIIATLVDLGVPEVVVAEAVAAIPITGFQLHFGTRVRSGIVATHLDVHVDEGQPQRTYGTIRRLLDDAPLSARVRELAQATFLRLAVAEAKVHRARIDDVHFHEVGAVDAIVDVVGSAAALDYIGADLVVSPLPMGRGYVKAAHGILPLPAPATVECLAGLATYDGGIDFEFVTPTGAAIVGAHARESARWPEMRPERVGWGAGNADLKDRPNVLRAVLGAKSASRERAGAGEIATHAVFEANIDDATGELVASCIEALFAAGALDAWATPITMKKGRPALTLSALAPIDGSDAIARVILTETTSLGVRRHDVSRVERPRRLAYVDTVYGRLPVKIAEGPFGPAQVKPEFDACLVAARAYGVPVREVLRAVLAAASTT